MATIPTQNKPTTTPAPRVGTSKKTKQVAGTLFTKDNHKWMAIGGILVVLGYILMSGGKSSDPNQFNYNEVYGTMRITIAPLLVLVGLGVLCYAIMKKSNTK